MPSVTAMIAVRWLAQAAMQEQRGCLPRPGFDFNLVGRRQQAELQFLKAFAAQSAQELIGQYSRSYGGKIARLLPADEKLGKMIQCALRPLFIKLGGKIRKM